MTTYVYYSAGNPKLNGSIQRITELPNGSWGNETPITIDGKILTNVADPDVTVLSNGTYLLAYSTLVTGSGTPVSGVPIYTAISTDGIHFTNAQPAFTIPSTEEVSDPSIVQLVNGSFLMSVGNFANPAGGVTFYISQNGQNYAPTGGTLTQSDISPDMVLLGDGSVRLYTTSGMGIVSFRSTDDGMTWTQEAGVRLAVPQTAAGGLVSVIQAGPNQWDMVYQQLINPSGPHFPMNDELTLATSTDGLNFTVIQTGFWTSASSAEVVVFPAVHPTSVFPFLNDPQSQLEMIYIGYFGRAGDPNGMNYWAQELSSAGDTVVPGLTGVAAAYSLQPEAFAQYPLLANPSTASQADIQTFVNAIYQNLFSHPADTKGLAYWMAEINGIIATHDPLTIANGFGQMSVSIALGAQGADQTSLANKTTVALWLTQQLEAAGIDSLGPQSKAFAFAHSLIASVTSDPASVSAAEAQQIPSNTASHVEITGLPSLDLNSTFHH